MTTIITTTGLSLYFKSRDEYKTDQPTDHQMQQLLRNKPSVASAEANSLLQIAQPDDHLVFLHTETAQAERCALLLRDFFLDKGFKSYQIKVKQLQFQEDEHHIETQGLHNLVNTIIYEIDEARRKNQDVIINATAGLKAQIVYSTMIGMIYQVPVKYIYETFRKVVTFTPIALDWNTNLFFSYSSFFQWIDNINTEVRTEREVEERLKAIPEPDKEQIRSMLTLPDSNGDIFLSPMGNALNHRFQRETEEAEVVSLPSDALETDFRKKIANSLYKLHHHPPKDIKAICEKIAKLSWVEGVIGGNYENTTLTRIKGFSERGTIWLLWADDKKAQNLTVQTTAEGRPQTRKVADKIKEILENH